MGRSWFLILSLLCLTVLTALFSPFCSRADAQESYPSPEQVNAYGTWSQIGPDGGDMHFVFITDEHTVIASHGFGGVWRSTDKGNTWSLVQDPDLVDVSFSAMDEVDGILFAGGNKGLWRSEDDGESWTRITVSGVPELNGDTPAYEIMSIVALSPDHLYVSVRLSKEYAPSSITPFEGVIEINSTGGSWSGTKYDGPFAPNASAIVMLDYDADFNGEETLFFSSSVHGLYVIPVEHLDNSSCWERILDYPSTRVSVDKEHDVVYVGTLEHWFYRLTFDGSSWTRQQIPIPGVRGKPTACFIQADPYNENKLWWGLVGGSRGCPWPPSEGESCFGIGIWDPDANEGRGGWVPNTLHNFSGWGNIIAIDHHREGENLTLFTTTVDGQISASTAFVPGGGDSSIRRTTDGGLSWERSYDFLWGDTMNEVVYIDQGVLSGHLVALCVSGNQISDDYGDSWLPKVDFHIAGVPGSSDRAGYCWAAASPPNAIDGEFDLLIATGFPPTTFKGNGLYAVSLSRLQNEREDFYRDLLSGVAIHQIVQVDWYSVLAVEGKWVGNRPRPGGVMVYDIQTDTSYDVDGGFPSIVGVYQLAYRVEGSSCWWFASTYEDIPPEDSDWYFYKGPGALYRLEVASSSPTPPPPSSTWEEVWRDPSGDDRVVAFSISPDTTEMLCLTSDGKLLYTEDFTETPISWVEYDLDLPDPDVLLTDMEVDWLLGLIFISTFGSGVFYTTRLDLTTSSGTVSLREFNDGLLTRRTRNLLLVPGPDYGATRRWTGYIGMTGGYLYVGTEGHSVWRCKVEEIITLGVTSTPTGGQWGWISNNILVIVGVGLAVGATTILTVLKKKR